MPTDVGGVVSWAIGILVAGGFSAGPWLIALLTGRLRPISWVREQLADRDAQIKTWQDTAAAQTKRADAAVAALATVAGESAATAVHLLQALPQKGETDERP